MKRNNLTKASVDELSQASQINQLDMMELGEDTYIGNSSDMIVDDHEVEEQESSASVTTMEVSEETETGERIKETGDDIGRDVDMHAVLPSHEKMQYISAIFRF